MFIEDNYVLNNILEGIIRLIFFILYVYIIGLNKDIKRVFAYHGAEHKTIAAYEDNVEINSNNISKIQRYNKEHPRCGTSFIMTVIVVSIVLHVFIPREPALLLYLSRILLFPIIAGLSYEECWYVGDKEFDDVIGSSSLGMQPVLINRSVYNDLRYLDKYIQISDLRQLYEIIKSL